jgi:MscS family membrane protein
MESERYLIKIFLSCLIIGSVWLFLRWKKGVQSDLLHTERRGKKLDTGFVQVMSKILSVSALVLSLLLLFQLWGLNMLPLITFGGIGAAGIAFAAKDVIANFFGGLMLHITRPFMIGDLILIPDRKVEGHVEEIGWSLTCLRDKDKRPLYLPNAIFSSIYVINSSRMTHRRIEEDIFVQHADFDKISGALEKVRAALASYPDIDAHLPMLIVLHSFTQQHIKLYLDCYILQTAYERYLRSKHELLSLLYTILREEGIETKPASLQISVVRSDNQI